MSEKSQPEQDQEISCSNCIAACCRAGATLILTQTEIYQNRRAMNLKALVRPKDYSQSAEYSVKGLPVHIPVPAHHGFYVLLEDCGHITEENKCAIYEDRPQVCRDYEVGSTDCVETRGTFGLDGNEKQLEPGMTVEIRTPKL